MNAIVYNVTKAFLFQINTDLSIHQKILKKMYSTVLNIDNNNNNKNVSWTANQHIRMISEGSCDWSNDAENLALITEINNILKYIQIESSYFK